MLQWTIGKLLLLPPKCFCCAIVFFFPLEKKCFKGQIRKHSLCMHLPKCFCCASVSSFPWFKGQIAEHSLLVHASSKVLLLCIFPFPLQNKCFQGTRGKLLLLPESLHFGKTFCPFCLASFAKSDRIWRELLMAGESTD